MIYYPIFFIFNFMLIETGLFFPPEFSLWKPSSLLCQSNFLAFDSNLYSEKKPRTTAKQKTRFKFNTETEVHHTDTRFVLIFLFVFICCHFTVTIGSSGKYRPVIPAMT